jgi:hypothetical protein
LQKLLSVANKERGPFASRKCGFQNPYAQALDSGALAMSQSAPTTSFGSDFKEPMRPRLGGGKEKALFANFAEQSFPCYQG